MFTAPPEVLATDKCIPDFFVNAASILLVEPQDMLLVTNMCELSGINTFLLKMLQSSNCIDRTTSHFVLLLGVLTDVYLEYHTAASENVEVKDPVSENKNKNVQNAPSIEHVVGKENLDNFDDTTKNSGITAFRNIISEASCFIDECQKLFTDTTDIMNSLLVYLLAEVSHNSTYRTDPVTAVDALGLKSTLDILIDYSTKG